jgi:23S rRNA (uracil1939-C5)-methyltransferase
MEPERIVYVSCDPGTLARDLKLLSARGYSPADGVAVDMFPHTPHVETVVLMMRK